MANLLFGSTIFGQGPHCASLTTVLSTNSISTATSITMDPAQSGTPLMEGLSNYTSTVKTSEYIYQNGDHIGSGLHRLKIQTGLAMKRMAAIKHPLSPAGRAFLESARDLLNDPNATETEINNILEKFPTVEEPHLEYFADIFQNVSKISLGKILSQLVAIQVGAGCTHDCTICATNTPKRLETMSYITVLKIAEFIKNNTKPLANEIFNKVKLSAEDIVSEMRMGTVNKRKIKKHILRAMYMTSERFTSFIEMALIGERLQKIRGEIDYYDDILPLKYKDKAVRALVGEWMGNATSKRRAEILDLALDRIARSKDHILLNGNDRRLFKESRLDWILKETTENCELFYKRNLPNPFYLISPHINYFDSDPLDYRDVSLRHKDGRPANYGDVYEVMTTLRARPLIRTVGPRSRDKVGIDALRKLKGLGAELRISVHFYHEEARRDRAAYRDSLKQIIEIMHPNLIFKPFGDEERSLIEDIFKELGLKAPNFEQQASVAAVGRARDMDAGLTVSRTYIYHDDGVIIKPNGDVVLSDEKTGKGRSMGVNIFKAAETKPAAAKKPKNPDKK